jgi:hypothetical protein
LEWESDINPRFKKGWLPQSLANALGNPESVAISWCWDTRKVVIRGNIGHQAAVELFFLKICDEGYLDWMIDELGTHWLAD